ncbi:MAG TPA: SDR family NAD(P)-dependent oxidoreductase [Magnetospirillaceae bacterium]|jgi:NAD(P)-dependent dehydrogenase (short-subunit alcohol dehydrogenase family)
MADQAKKTALITGSTDGVGRVVAKQLGALDFHVLTHGRDAKRGASIVAEIEKAGGTAEFLQADLSSLAEVRRLADVVQQKTSHFELLINNAGIGSGGSSSGREKSADGYELRFAVNYLSGFLLTHCLLRKSTPARIVNVSSVGQQALDFADLQLTHGYSGARAYCQSKLAQVMFTIDLARVLDGTGIIVNSLHPATYMDTTMVRQAGVTPWSSVEDGAKAIMKLAVGAELSGKSGLFFNGLEESRADRQAYDAAARQKLETASFQLIGQYLAAATAK